MSIWLILLLSCNQQMVSLASHRDWKPGETSRLAMTKPAHQCYVPFYTNKSVKKTRLHAGQVLVQELSSLYANLS